IPIRGNAFAGNRGVATVEVSTDGGQTWQAARIDYPGTTLPGRSGPLTGSPAPQVTTSSSRGQKIARANSRTASTETRHPKGPPVIPASACALPAETSVDRYPTLTRGRLRTDPGMTEVMSAHGRT